MNNKNNQIQGQPFSDQTNLDEIDLLNILTLLKVQKKLIMLLVFLGLIAGVAIALLLPRYYEVTVTVIPNEQQNSEQASLGRIAILTGLGGATGQVTEKEVGLLILQSRSFILDFIEKNKIKDHLYQGTSPEELKSMQPAKIYEDFYNLLSVEQELTSNDIKISLLWKDAELAKQWLISLLADLNKLMRERAKIKGEDSLAYLNNQLNRSIDSDIRQTFIAMIKQEIQKMMLVDIREEYLFETIDEPITPAYPSKPNRKLIVIFSVFVAFVIGLIAAIYLEVRKRNRTTSK